MNKDHFRLEDFEPQKELTSVQLTRKKDLWKAAHDFAKAIINLAPNVRARDRALSSVMDARIFAESAIEIGATVLTHEVLPKFFAKVEGRDSRVVRVWMNIKQFADLRKYSSNYIDPTSNRDVLRAGKQGVIFNAEIWTARKIPENFIVVIGDDEGNEDLNVNWTPTEAQLSSLYN